MTDPLSSVEYIRELTLEIANVDLKIMQRVAGDRSCVVWDADVVLVKYLDILQSKECDFTGKVIVDIGSGTGISGLAAAALGANAILTDLPEVIPFLEKNIKLNEKNLKGSASAVILSWGEPLPPIPVPDYILVSDCVYNNMSVEKLIPTLHDLAGPLTQVLISYVTRTAGPFRKRVEEFLEALGKSFVIENVSQSKPQSKPHSTIHIVKCVKKSA